MTRDELTQRLQGIEWDDFEVKAAKCDVPKDVWPTVSAFSNTSGGWIVFGVEQRGKRFMIEGVENGEKIESDFLDNLRNGQKFNKVLTAKGVKYTIDGKLVLASIHSEIDYSVVTFYLDVPFVSQGVKDKEMSKTDSKMSPTDGDTVPDNEKMSPTDSENVPDSGKMSPTDGDTVPDNENIERWNRRKDSIRELMANNPDISVKTIAETLGVNERTIKRDIKDLRENGIIERIGGNFGGKWIIINKESFCSGGFAIRPN